MNLITQLKLKNFKCFRNEKIFDFAKSTYLVGINNSGKTAALQGVRYFFDNDQIKDGSFLNKAEFARKQSGYNRADITITFNLEVLTTKKRKNDLIKKYGKFLSVAKSITFTPESESTNVAWKINSSDLLADLPDGIRWLFGAVKLTYIHPQEGSLLLKNVQKRLRQRLLANWGRGAALTHNLKELEDKWNYMRDAANKYLSQSLTDSVQSFWPESKVTIDLPKKVREIIDIADINFQGDKALPEIELTSQGTGAQSTILYLAHYLLDSDRSLNRGEYHPIWLMEEPESFLHADLLAKLSKQLNSDKWLQNIQMIISSHSPILLASSRATAGQTRWTILGNFEIEQSIMVDKVSDNIIDRLGVLMGDNNFSAYFAVAEDKNLVFLEDKRELTLKVFRDSGINLTKGLEGVPEVGKFLDVLKTTPELLRSKAFFIVDNDKGLSQLSRHLSNGVEKEGTGFKRYKCSDISEVYIICLPESKIVEDLFAEYDNHLSNCISKIWDAKFKVLDSTPSNLARVVGQARAHEVKSKEDQIKLIKNTQDVKDLFWKDVEKNSYNISRENKEALMKLTN
ncbi:MAG: AAA family ATPase [Patescibacteria group bacterium]